MTNGELIQRVQSLYSKGVHSDDTRLRSRHIYNKLLSVRAFLLKRRVNDKNRISQWNYQVLPCVEMINAPIHECECIPSGGCIVLRSKYKIPAPITVYDRELIQSVTSLDYSTVYNRIAPHILKYQKDNKYTSSKANYYIKNGYLYLTTKNYPEVVTITGIFNNPLEADNFKGYCCNNDNTQGCISIYEKEFPLDLDLIDSCIDLAANELIEIFNSNREDLTNNSADNAASDSK